MAGDCWWAVYLAPRSQGLRAGGSDSCQSRQLTGKIAADRGNAACSSGEALALKENYHPHHAEGNGGACTTCGPACLQGHVLATTRPSHDPSVHADCHASSPECRQHRHDFAIGLQLLLGCGQHFSSRLVITLHRMYESPAQRSSSQFIWCRQHVEVDR